MATNTSSKGSIILSYQIVKDQIAATLESGGEAQDSSGDELASPPERWRDSRTIGTRTRPVNGRGKKLDARPLDCTSQRSRPASSGQAGDANKSPYTMPLSAATGRGQASDCVFAAATMATPAALILRAPGANCDEETQFAFERAGARADRIHVQRLRDNPHLLRDYQILAIPGGFAYGDDIAAGRILAAELNSFLADSLRQFRDADKLVIGICNGFQVLLKAGLLIPPDDDGPLATLAHNQNGRFNARWIQLRATPGACVWLKGCDQLFLPVAHGEGKFVCRKEWILKGLEQSGQIVLRYVVSADQAGSPSHNPNGSQGDVAGLCDVSGRVLGLMPHPERHVMPTQHPRWTRDGLRTEGDGLKLFRNAISYFQTD
jgi:phosphoribosylformylglycinamidine synthase subunit PurQ / glutaminase